jgi:isocitrate dehydrogenase kinase/phosphatase
MKYLQSLMSSHLHSEISTTRTASSSLPMTVNIFGRCLSAWLRNTVEDPANLLPIIGVVLHNRPHGEKVTDLVLCQLDYI